MLTELVVSGLPDLEELRRRLVELVRENIDAFAATPTDLGRTSMVIYTIKTGDAKPFKHRLRLIPFARRQHLKQEVDRLLDVGAISSADPGACPYASRTVFSTKNDATLRVCIDYRDLNAQTEKDVFCFTEDRPRMTTTGEGEILCVTGPAHGLPTSGVE